MAENENPTTEAPAQEPEGNETDWKAESRKWEQRAKESHRRVQELEPIENRFRELEESSKSEIQKAIERAEAAERAAETTQAEKLRTDVAAAKGVPVALLSGGTQEELEASADAILAFRDETARKGNYAPNEGRTSDKPANNEKREFTRQVFGNN